MLVTTLSHRGIEFLQQLFLFGSQIDRCFDGNLREQVAPPRVPHCRYALSAQAKNLAGLCPNGNLERNDAVQCGQLDLAAERRFGDADGKFAGQVGAITTEYLMWFDSQLDIKVAGRPAIAPCLAFSGQSYSIAIINAGWNLYG